MSTTTANPIDPNTPYRETELIRDGVFDTETEAAKARKLGLPFRQVSRGPWGRIYLGSELLAWFGRQEAKSK